MGREMIDELTTLLTRRYPRFVYRQRPERMEADYLPIFAFHSLEPRDFEAKLRYLQANRYRTITLDEAVAGLRGEVPLAPRSVVLTIDDGRMSTWTVGYPLLRKYGMTATSYVTPGYLVEGPRRPTLEDVWAGRQTLERVAIGEAEDRNSFMTWSEVEALHSSGVVQIEAHTMLHRDVAYAPRLVGFVTPTPPKYWFDLPLDVDAQRPWSTDLLYERLGTPIFASAPILSLARAWEPDRTLVERCRQRVQEEGGPAFFAQRDATRRLRRMMQRAKPWAGRLVDLAPMQQWELEASKRALEERLPGKTIRHFCYPKTKGSRQGVAISASLGYESNAWGLLPRRGANRSGADPMYLERLKHDYIYRLPGDGRHSVARLLRDKAKRRLRGDTGF